MSKLGASFIIKHFLVLSLFVCVGTACCPEKPDIVKHIVFNKFKSNLTQTEIEEIIAHYGNLKNLVPEMKEWKWGKDLGPEIEDRAHGFTHSFESTFYGVQDFLAFFYAPPTLKFGSIFFPACEKVVVINHIVNDSFPYKWSLPYRWSPFEMQAEKRSLRSFHN